MRAKGKLTTWKDEKGFGFITPTEGGKQIFVHVKAFTTKKRPLVGEIVTYLISADKRGRPCAEKVVRAGEVVSADDRKKRKTSYAFWIVMAFFSLVSLSVLTKTISFLLLPYYLIISFLTFCWYWKDKLAAQNDKWRTPESTLHILSLLGGWPGGLIAQQLLRHKSKKHAFRSVFWLTVLLNIGFLIWLHTSEGSEFFNSMLNTFLDLNN